ncbi:MAG: VCBS repeat-containing protein [Methylovulum miyakonense]|uniref:FG-GAP repeat domain-containing protein n=1 Tax=Methylovulum miyakonense TaxID=645578 RepID=UPI003BB7685E
MAANFQNYILQTGTALHETDDSFTFALGNWNSNGRPDLFIIKKSNTGTGSTEVSILSGDSNYQHYLLQTGTALHQTDHSFEFAVADWNKDGWQDLVIIKKSNTGTGSTEVSVLSGATNFRQYLLQTGTPLHQTDGNFSFAVADWTGDGRPDLFVIKKNDTGTGSTEVSILSGSSNYQEYLLQTGTALHQTDDSFNFAVADWNNDGWPDLIIVKKNNTGTGSTEVSVLSGATNFQHYLLQTGTPQHVTDHNYAFLASNWGGRGDCDLAVIKKNNTGTKSTEISFMR